MSRQDFQLVRDVSVVDIQLDVENARIRAGEDQNDCIARILRKEDQLVALMEDIAANGLTTMPILVSPGNDGAWVVKDGNRRITALKLLNDPDLCPEERLKPRLRSIRKKAAGEIPSVVDVLTSNNQEAVIREVLARHSGAAGGVGQLDWSAYLRTVYLLNNGHTAEYRRPGQYVFWAERQGIAVDDAFPITSLQRFFTVENLKLLGFDVKADELVPNLSVDLAKRMAQLVVNAFQTSAKRVDDVRTPDLAQAYIREVRASVGLIDKPTTPDAPASPPDNGTETKRGNGTTSPDKGAHGGSPNGANGTGSPKGEEGTTDKVPSPPRASPSPRLPAWDRIRLFGSRSPNLPIPSSETKATTIVAELRNLNVKETPLAATMLLRALIELSDEHYRKTHGMPDQQKLAKNILVSANRMRDSSQLDKSQYDIVSRHVGPGGPATALQIENLQKMIHRDTHHPNYQLLNTFWDDFGCFVRACWLK